MRRKNLLDVRIFAVLLIAFVLVPGVYAQETVIDNFVKSLLGPREEIIFETADTIPPSVFAYHFPISSQPGQPVTIISNASDDSSIDKIEVYINNQKVKICFSEACTYSFTPVDNTVYHVISYDSYGNSQRDPESGYKLVRLSGSNIEKPSESVLQPTSVSPRPGNVIAATISGCQSITSPGNYVLSGDLVGTNGCIVVQASNVFIDGWNPTLGRKNKITLTGGTDCHSNGQCAIHISSGNNIIISGIESNSGIRQYGPSNFVTIENSTLSMISIWAGDDVIMKNNSAKTIIISGRGTCAVPDPPYRYKMINNNISGNSASALFESVAGPSLPDCNPSFNIGAVIENNTIINTYFGTSSYTATVYYRGGNTNNIFKGNRIIANNGVTMMFIRDGVDNNLFENNYFESDSAERGVFFFGSGSDTFQDLPSGNIFRNNTFIGKNTAAIVTQGIGADNVFENNVFFSGARGSYGNNLIGGINTIVRHNTFYSKDAVHAAINLEGGPFAFTNNIVAHSGSPNIYSCAAGSQSGYSGNNNVFDGTSSVSICGNSLLGWRAVTGDDTNSIDSNPLFVNVNSYDMHLQDGSPACDINGGYAGAYSCGGEPPAGACADTDGGIDYMVFGRVTIQGDPSAYDDFCINSTQLQEYYCNSPLDEVPSVSLHNCADGCRIADGKCNRKPVINNLVATPTSGNVPLSVSFNASVTDPDGDALIYKWDFDSNGVIDSTLATPNYVYLTAGMYTATLVINDGRADSAPATTTLIANSVGPDDITFISPTPDDGYVTSSGDIAINAALSPPVAVDRLDLNFGGTMYSLPSMLSCSFENTYVCDHGKAPTSTPSGTVFNAGKFGQGVFVDSTDALMYPSSNLNTSGGTIMFWIKPNITWVTPNGYLLFDAYNDATSTGLLIWKPSNVNYIRAVRYANGNVTVANGISTTFTPEVWHHVAVTYGNGLMELYIDGNMEKSVEHSGTISAFNPNMYIGTRRTLSLASTSTIDEFKTYSNRLSATEIANIYDKESGSYFVKLTNLPDNTYTYSASAVRSSDQTILNSELRTFTVDTIPPLIISGPNISPSTNNAVISWTTDEPSTSIIEYSSGGPYNAASDASLVINHNITISGLAQSTVYYYRITSADALGGVTESTGSFTTLFRRLGGSSGPFRIEAKPDGGILEGVIAGLEKIIEKVF